MTRIDSSLAVLLRRFVAFGVLLVGSASVAIVATAATVRVPEDAATIAAGVSLAAAGDTVLVACGTYLEHDIALPAGITVRSENGDPACVTIDAAQQGRVFDVQSQVQLVTIEGITFTGGFVNLDWWDAFGGAIRCFDSTIRVADCSFTGNVARVGAGIGVARSTVEIERCDFVANDAVDEVWAAGGGMILLESTGVIRGCTFDRNTAFSTNPADPGDGGALLANDCSLTIEDCNFLSNATSAGAGGFYSLNSDSSALLRCHFEDNTADFGGAIYFESASTATVDSSSFVRNVGHYGGALLIDRTTRPKIRDSVFVENRTDVFDGGAVKCYESQALFQRCVFERNTAATDGGAIAVGGGTSNFEDCFFLDNAANVAGGAVHNRLGFGVYDRCTFVGNEAPSGSQFSLVEFAGLIVDRSIAVFGVGGAAVESDSFSNPDFECSNIFGNAGGDWIGEIAGQDFVLGNRSVDPQFVDAVGGDYQLACASALSSENATSCGPMGAFGDDCVEEEPTAAPAARADQIVVNVAPNPFNPRTSILLTVGSARELVVDLLGVDGRRVQTLASGWFAAGEHRLVWDGRDDRGVELASGVYLLRVDDGVSIVGSKLVLVR